MAKVQNLVVNLISLNLFYGFSFQVIKVIVMVWQPTAVTPVATVFLETLLLIFVHVKSLQNKQVKKDFWQMKLYLIY